MTESQNALGTGPTAGRTNNTMAMKKLNHPERGLCLQEEVGQWSKKSTAFIESV